MELRPDELVGDTTLTQTSSRPAIVAYTAVFGDHPGPHVQPITPDVPLICFTDQPSLAIPGYEIRRVDVPGSTPRRRARYVKLMAHTLFPDAEWTIWFDVSIRFKTGRLSSLIEHSANCSLAIHPHARRDCIYDEAEVCKTASLDDPQLIDEQVSRYRNAGHPRREGLWESTILIRRLSNPRIREMNTTWWDEMQRGSVRDQLSLPVVLRRLNVAVQPLPGSVYDSPFASLARGGMADDREGRVAGSIGVPWLEARFARRLFREDFYRDSNADVFGSRAAERIDPYDHYCRHGWREGRDPHPLFDVSYYLERYPAVARAGVEPLAHYVAAGAAAGYDPHVLVDASWYGAAYGHACHTAAGGALGHYLRYGWRAGLRPNRWFNPAGYLDSYPDVRASGIEPLEHYLRFGIREGRDIRDHSGTC